MYIVVVILLTAVCAISIKWHEERTARRRLEQILRGGEVQSRPEEARGLLTEEFVSVLSHELRTPLTPILGAAYMLRSEPNDPRIFERSLELIERNAKAQSKIIEDLLDVSRILSGKLRISMETVELEPVVQAVVETVRPACDAKNIDVRMDLQPLNGVVSGDSVRLHQVVWHLVGNAVKFTPRGGKISVDLYEADSCAELRVSDNGMGISPDFLPFVFDRFRQADASRTRAVGGLGLGLSIVRHLVESHGGSVHAHSRGTQQGATFIVRLPLRSVPHPAMRAHVAH